MENKIASSITRLEYEHEDAPRLTATRFSLRGEVPGVHIDEATVTSEARLLLTQTPADLNLEHATLGALLAYLGNAVHNQFHPNMVVETRLSILDATTGQPVPARVTATAGDQVTHDDHHDTGHARLVTPMSLDTRVTITAAGYPPLELNLVLLRDRHVTLRLQPSAAYDLDERRAWLEGRLSDYEREFINRACEPTREKLEAAKTALSVAMHATRAALTELDAARGRLEALERAPAEELAPTPNRVLEVR